jgi:4-hydroxybenzoate polyprenyltransferase
MTLPVVRERASFDRGKIEPPLAVDLDGTLIKSDSLHENLILYLKASPLKLLHLPNDLRAGRAAFKRKIARNVAVDASLLPYNTALLDFLYAAKHCGRRIGLFTAADQSIADGIAAHLGFFDAARGSDGQTNLSGHAKLAAIQEVFGPSFAYAGDAPVDRSIFDAAESVILVGPASKLREDLEGKKRIEAVFAKQETTYKTWLRALRLQHWAKNSLVFVAPVLGLQELSLSLVFQALLLFVLLSVLASATYLINDLLDLQADRQHPEKRFRPLAAGDIAVRDCLAVATSLILGAAALSALLPIGARAALFGYLVLTLCYSVVLKRIPMIDVLVLAGLFTVRVMSGGFLLATPTSPWLLTFSMLFFLGLAMIKRYAELERVLQSNSEGVHVRGYTSLDLPLLLTVGVASGVSAVVIFTIYLINEQYPRHLYKHPDILWCIMPVLLLWTLMLWHLSVHGRMNEDPVVFALKDPLSLILGAVIAAILVMAWA